LDDESDHYVLDFFAGSGTTAHAVLNLNAEDGGARRYILVEVGEYFDTVLRPRIAKVMFSREWRDGKPTSNDGHSHIFKYQRLESYEDTLNNIAFSAAGGQTAIAFEDYLLRYMLDFETRDSETLLNAAKLESPFSYTLLVHRDGETREQPVDLPETFNYLIGLQVKTRRVYRDGDRRYLVYRGSNQRSEVVVIWRDTKGWTQADLERDKQFILKHKLTEGADEIFVNGDSFVPGAKALDPVFKRLMLGGTD
jgi:adenine-specific DNA-methyltransferase